MGSDRVQETRCTKFSSVIESLTLHYDLKNGCFFIVCCLWPLPLNVTWIISQISDGLTMGRHVHVHTMELSTKMAIKFAYLNKLCFKESLDTSLECISRHRSSTTRPQEFRSPGGPGDDRFLRSVSSLSLDNVLVFYC